MDGITIKETLENMASIIGIIATISGLVSGWILWRNGIFNIRKIQTYKLKEYKYTAVIFKSVYVLLNPILFIGILFLVAFLSSKINDDYHTRMFLLFVFYAVFIMLIYIIEWELLKKQKQRLKIVLSSILDKNLEKEKQILLAKDKNYAYNILMLNFIITIPIVIWNVDNYIGYILFIVEFLIYIISILVMNFKASIYKNKVYIKSKSVIRVDYTKEYGCFCKMTLKKEFSVKDENNHTIIFYPEDISVYTIKPENLINISIGYEIVSEKDNNYLH